MLILTRRSGEDIIISNSITVSVLGMKGGQVKLGFDAPRDVTIHRKEIQDRINAEENIYNK